MQYIDDIWPRNIIDHDKFRTFLELCKIRDDFLKSLTTVRYGDYLIDRKLVKAGGLGKKIYIHLARGANRNISAKRILEYLAEGRGVAVVNGRTAFKKPTQMGCYRCLYDPIMDRLYEGF